MTHVTLEKQKNPSAPNLCLGYEDIRILKKLIAESKSAGKDQFTYKGNEILVRYAEYAVEYMTSVYKEFQ